MKKIGITTFYNTLNYGAFLQCFALQKKLEEKYNTTIINYSNAEIDSNYKIIKTQNIKRVAKSLIYIKDNIKRKNNFRKCIGKYFPLTSIDDKYDIVIAGSDQIWNKELTNGLDDIFTLKYFNNTKKISYASSIGNENLISENKDEYKSFIENIDIVSVREESAKEELQKITKKNIGVNLDPTMLLSREEWDKYTNENKIDEKYIFSYFIGVTQENYDALNLFSDLTELKVLSYSEHPKEKNILKKCYSDGPIDFISKIKYAEYVFTSSFHGTVFSIIFNKQFICMLPKKRPNRLINLLTKLGLEDRIIRNIDDLKNFNYKKQINYKEVNKKLGSLRNKSVDWLEKAIEKTKVI